jgi:simple sugar transport system permease protein
VSPSRRTSAADQKIREVGIVTESSEQPIGQLSGGNQQKTAVARALTSEPKVLVLVAPTQGVDVASKEALFQIMGSAAAEKMAVLIVSDDLDELATCDRLEIIFRGKIEAGASTMSSPRWKDFGESMNVDAVQGEVGAATTAVLRMLFTLDLLLIPVIIFGSFVSPGFLLPENLMNVLQQSSELSILVIAESIILLCGKFDLPLESTVGFAPMVAAWLMVPDTSIGGSGVGVGGYTGIAVVLAIGLLIGLINGLLIVKLRFNAFITTLAVLTLPRGAALGMTNGQTLFNLPDPFLYLGSTKWFGVPVSVWVAGILYAAAATGMRYHRFGRAIYTIGGNPEAARVAGIPVDRITIAVVYVLGGGLAGLAGIMLTGRIASAMASQGQNMIFYVFAAAVIGGISLNGGQGRSSARSAASSFSASCRTC